MASVQTPVPASTMEDLMKTMPKVYTEVLGKADEKPFDDDFEYLLLIFCINDVNLLRVGLSGGMEERLFESNSRDFASPSAAAFRNGPLLLEQLEQLLDRLELKRQTRLKAHTQSNTLAPRLERICIKYGFTRTESRIFWSIVANTLNGSILHGRRYCRPKMLDMGACTGVTLAMALSCSLKDVQEFFNPNRKHIKEALVPASAQIHLAIGTISQDSVLLLLLGLQLTPSQFLPLENSTIAQVLVEEPDFLDTPAGRAFKINADESGHPHSPPLPHPPTTGPNASATDAEVCDVANTEGPEGDARRPRKHSRSRSLVAIPGPEKGESLYELLKREEKMEKEEWQKVLAQAHPPPPPRSPPPTHSPRGGGKKAERAEEKGEEGGKGTEAGQGLDVALGLSTSGEGDKDEDQLKPYSTDLQYMQDQFALMVVLMKTARVRKQKEDKMGLDNDDDDDKDNYYDYMGGRYGMPQQREQAKQNWETKLRKLRTKETLLKRKLEKRLSLTASLGPWIPRLERLTEALSLDSFEKNLLIAMAGATVAPSTINFAEQGFRGLSSRIQVMQLLNCFCGSLEEQIKCRKYFYKSATLVKEGLLNIENALCSDLTDCAVEIDRRMLDFIVGLDTEFSELIDGSHLYMPSVCLEDVVMPEDTKKMVLDTVQNYAVFKAVQKDIDLDKKITYGNGLNLLFHGPSGTGKTMLANALATHLKKKILLINFPYLGDNNAGAVIKLVFREAKIHDAILFFDEAESIFMTRDSGSHRVNLVLTELERHDGLSILATNRPYQLDEAMYRRITLAIEFKKPDHLLRLQIWQNLCPPKLRLHDDVDLMELATKFELTGGFIKNTWLTALSLAVTRDGPSPCVTMEDLRKGANHQLRGRLSMVDFDRRIVPTRGLDSVILPDPIKRQLSEIINYGKAQSILFGQWGFGAQHGTAKGIAALFSGPPGTGKTMAAEAIGYDLGKPLKVVNCAQLISKWVGESAKNIDAVFEEAKAVDAVLVFDEAEGLFGSRSADGDCGASRHDTQNVGILLHLVETFNGVCIIITNLKERIDPAFHRRMKFTLDFPLPDEKHREQLWQLILPKEAPRANNVDFGTLARRFSFAGGNIKSAVFRAAMRAALRETPEERVISMDDLMGSAQEEADKTGDTNAPAVRLAMYS